MNMELKKKLTLKFRLIFTGIVTLLFGLHLAWDYDHGGVPSHHFLHNEDLPAISNWWGVVILPVFTWFLLSLIKKRGNATKESDRFDSWMAIRYGFLSTLLFGLTLSYFFAIGSNIPGNMMLGLLVISFIIPIYRSEYLLGFVLGMFYTFGGILPIIIGVVLWTIFTINYKWIRKGVLFLISKINSTLTKKQP